MPYPVRIEAAALTVPTMMQELGPEPLHLFSVMHVTAACRCLQARGLLSTRILLAEPDPKIIGAPSLVTARLGQLMPAPLLGAIADAVPLSFTPLTAAALASFRPRESGAQQFRASELVVAVIPFHNLVASGLPLLFLIAVL